MFTNKRLYNINGTSIKRKILNDHLTGISYSTKNKGEFVVHVLDEYDYWYTSDLYCRDIISAAKFAYNQVKR